MIQSKKGLELADDGQSLLDSNMRRGIHVKIWSPKLEANLLAIQLAMEQQFRDQPDAYLTSLN
jgi:hypothetical protein